jgi:lycopene cyclase domain-containing protein
MMAVFIPWDIAFTNNSFWGFNEDYITGIKFLNLPIEEWLFFICIPYACIFTHYSLLELSPKFKFSKRITSIIYTSIVTTLIVTLWYHYDKWYTALNFGYALLVLGFIINYKPQILPSFFATYIIILIPFFLVNGVLTGTGIEDQVVWYNNTQNIDIRMATIPIEDTIYNLGMLLTVFGVIEVLEQRKN